MKTWCGWLVTLGMVGGAVAADIYKWTDDEGRVHFGDAPPPASRAERIGSAVTAAADEPGEADAGEARRLRLLEAAERAVAERLERRRAGREARAREQEAAVADEAACFDARKQIDVLNERMPVYRDERGRFRVHWQQDTYEGERQYLDDAMRAQEIGHLVRIIETRCAKPDDPEQQARARYEQIRDERCEAAMAEFEALARPGSRTPKSELDKRRYEMMDLCGF